MSENFIEVLPRSDFVLIRPRRLGYQETRLINTKYTQAVMLALNASKELRDGDTRAGPLSFAGFTRNKELEAITTEWNINSNNEEKMTAKEIADCNFTEMARATAQKWYCALNYMFLSVGEELKIELKGNDGRIKIAIPGCHLGFEAGGILRFLNEQGIAAVIDMIDLGSAGNEKDLMDLDKLENELGSKVNFMPHTDATEFLIGKKYDIAVLRHPGPINEQLLIEKWRELFEKVVMTNPKYIILSTYDHEIDDPEVLASFDKARGDLRESDVIFNLFSDLGYKDALPEEGAVMDDRLQYPISVYMTAHDIDHSNPRNPKLKWRLPVDRYMTMLTKAK